MNIRSLSNPAQVLAKTAVEASKTIKSDDTDEREANGQQAHSDPDSHRPLTDEEMQKVLDKLKSHDGIRKHGLNVEYTVENENKIVKLVSPDGQIIKRFVERDLYFYLFKDGIDDLQLVRKSA